MDYMPPHVKRKNQVEETVSFRLRPSVVAQIFGVLLVGVSLGSFPDIQLFIELCVRVVDKLLVHIAADPMVKRDTILTS